MKDLAKTIYKEFLIFYIVYLGLFEVSLVLFAIAKPDNSFVVIIGFIGMLMFVGGIYVVSFIYGIYFQAKHNFEFSRILFFTGLLFILGLISFSTYWLKLYALGDHITLYYLIGETSFQALSFFAGSIIVKFIGDFKQLKTKKPSN